MESQHLFAVHLEPSPSPDGHSLDSARVSTAAAYVLESAPSPARKERRGSQSPVEHEPATIWSDVANGRRLVAGWYDEGGRRYLIVRPKPEGERSTLSNRERKALKLRAMGYALKVIADELNVSLSTASRDVSRAMAFVGLHSDSDVAAVFGHGTL
jgi:DNA-binding NarL/FixJ family response regulator